MSSGEIEMEECIGFMRSAVILPNYSRRSSTSPGLTLHTVFPQRPAIAAGEPAAERAGPNQQDVILKVGRVGGRSLVRLKPGLRLGAYRMTPSQTLNIALKRHRYNATAYRHQMPVDGGDGGVPLIFHCRTVQTSIDAPGWERPATSTSSPLQRAAYA